MLEFNADEARKISASCKNNELHDILFNIKSEAEQGEEVLHIYKPLKLNTVELLRNRGFRVIIHLSSAIQKDDLYYSIYWDK